MRFSRGEAFVPEMDGEGESFAQRVREGLGFQSLWADVAGHVQRMAEHDGRAGVPAQQASDGFQVLLRVFANQSEDRLCGEAQFVGHCDANTAAAEIEAQQAGLHTRDGTASAERKPHLRMG